MDTSRLTIDELRELYDDRVRDLEHEYNRANAAEAEAEACHAFLDECDIPGDQGRAVPLVDRVVLLVSWLARATGGDDGPQP